MIIFLLSASLQGAELSKLLRRRGRWSTTILGILAFFIVFWAWERWSVLIFILLSTDASELTRTLWFAGSVVFALLDLSSIDDGKCGESNGSNEEQFHGFEKI
jgi:hypothetical protein